MALILDTGPLLAALDRSDRNHEACAHLLQTTNEQLAIPAPILTEWTATAARAVELDPRDVYAYDMLGYSHFMRALRRRALVYCHGDDLVQQAPAARRARRRWFDAADRIVAIHSVLTPEKLRLLNLSPVPSRQDP